MVRMLHLRVRGGGGEVVREGQKWMALNSTLLRPLGIGLDREIDTTPANKKIVSVSSNDRWKAKTDKHFDSFRGHALSFGSDLFYDEGSFAVDGPQLGSINWERHRNQWRHLLAVLSLVKSRVIGSSIPPVVYCMTLFSTLVVLWNYSVMLKWVPHYFPLLRLNAFPFMISLTLLSYLLTFRTNASYGRFDEVSKMCASIVSRSREISRFTMSYLSTKGLKARRISKVVLRHLQAFPLTYKHEFLKTGSLEKELRAHTMLTQNEIDGIMQSSNRPNYVIHVISECIHNTDIHPFQKSFMDSQVTGLLDGVGGSERIFKTPLPMNYTQLTSQTLMIWHFFLPFALWDACQWGTSVVFFLIATLLFRIEEVGMSIEQPFSVIPLDEMVNTVKTDISDMITQHEVVEEEVVKLDSPKFPEPHDVCSILKNLTPGIFLLLNLPLNLEPTTTMERLSNSEVSESPGFSHSKPFKPQRVGIATLKAQSISNPVA